MSQKQMITTAVVVIAVMAVVARIPQLSKIING